MATAALIAVPAVAYADPPSSADRISAHIDDVAPDQGEVVAPREAAQGKEKRGDESVEATVVNEGHATTVQMPLNPSSPVLIRSDALDPSSPALIRSDAVDAGRAADDPDLPNLEVNLPIEVEVTDGEIAEDGTVVFESTSGGADAAVQTLDDGSVRLQTIIPDAASGNEFTYRFGDDVAPVSTEDGSIALVTSVEDGPDVSVGTIDAPWAVDASGRSVDTEYRIDGTNLVQVIHVDESTEYPIVADPKVSIGMGIYIYAYGSEWKGFAAGVIGAGGALVVGGCVAANVPNGWAWVLRLICGSIGASNVNNYFKWVASAVRSVNLRNSTCYEFKRWKTWTGPKAVSASNCR